MKFFLPLSFLLLLSACQTTPPEHVDPDEVITGEEVVEVVVVDEKEGLEGLVKPSEVVYDNLWLKLAEGFTFDVPDNERIKKQRDYYLSHPKYLKQVSKRAEPFLHLIVEKIEKEGLPLELALLPVVESTFNPYAYSYVGASGLWQFMPATGKRFGLQQNWWYDGRRDVYRSSDAALVYMGKLHRYLGEDWLLAFAAYNSGEGRVSRAAQRNKKNNLPVDFWNLDLPTETENYVPKLLALVDILRNHKKYGIDFPVLENKQVLTYVGIDSQLDLAYAGKLANLSLAEIKLLNPAFNQWATAPKGPHHLLIPTISVENFLAQLKKESRVTWDRYKVKSGDSLSVIAQNHHTSSNVLHDANKLNGSLIKIGQILLVPMMSKSQQAMLTAQAKRIAEQQQPLNRKNKRKITYVVTEGDNLWDISRLYNVTTADIAKWNSLNLKNTLRLGQKLNIWKETKVVQVTVQASKDSYHTVVKGDSLWKIGKRYDVSTNQLAKWNKLTKTKSLKLGQKIAIRKPVKQVNYQYYIVVSGDNLWDISKKYGVSTTELAKWNHLSKKKKLKLGLKLVIKRATKRTTAKYVAKNMIAYRVVSGDNLWTIARHFGVSHHDLVAWNNLGKKNKLSIGQVLVIKKKKETKKASVIDKPLKYITYKVKSGDSLGAIALTFNVKVRDLKRWNDLKNSHAIKIGQKLKVQRKS
jgi:membrane-bound lytic murein transglycosylase D